MSRITFKNSSAGTVEAVPGNWIASLRALETHGFGSVTRGLTAHQVGRAHELGCVRRRPDPLLVNVLLVFGVQASAESVSSEKLRLHLRWARCANGPGSP